jgi:plasmid stabilization system protein ParE
MRKLVITSLAKEDTKNVLEFIEAKWGESSRMKFSNKLNKNLNLIAFNPELFPKSEINNRIRKCVISKQSSLFYTFDNYEIKVLMVFDTRQNPNKVTKIK